MIFSGLTLVLDDLALLLLTIMLLFGLLDIFIRPKAFIEFPNLATMLALLYLFPFAVHLNNDPALPDRAFSLTTFYMAASLAFLYLGWRIGIAKSLRFIPVCSETRLTIVALVLGVIGLVATLSMRLLSPEELSQRQASGPLSIMFFFLKFTIYGLVLATLVYAKTTDKRSLFVLALCAATVIPYVVYGGRREGAAHIVLLVVSALIFWRGWVPPRYAIASALMIGFLALHLVGEYRSAVQVRSELDTLVERKLNLDRLSQIRVEESLDFSDALYSDFGNAVRVMAGVTHDFSFNFGLYYWDRLVFSFVPAQIVGNDVKSAMYLLGNDVRDVLWEGVPHIGGSTFTAFADSYSAFGVFGVMVFFWVGWVTARLYAFARRGSILHQWIYISLLGPFITAISHQSSRFVENGVLFGILSVLTFLYVRPRKVPTAAFPKPARLRFRLGPFTHTRSPALTQKTRDE
jgi:hypothetical protein